MAALHSIGWLKLLESDLAAFLVTDSDCVLGLVEKDLAVTDLACSGMLDDGFDDGFDPVILYYHFQPNLRNQSNLIFSSAIGFGMPLLSAMPTSLRDGHTFHTKFRERFLYSLKPVRPYDSLDLRHCALACTQSSYSREQEVSSRL